MAHEIFVRITYEDGSQEDVPWEAVFMPRIVCNNTYIEAILKDLEEQNAVHREDYQGQV
jgi:hypothetical protein